MDDMQNTNAPVLGHIAGAALGDVDCLLLPWRIDPFYRLRPVLNAQALRLSAELCDMTYFLTLDPWTEAGWTDVSIQVDNSLQSGVTASVGGEQVSRFLTAWKRLRAKSQLKEYNPVSQVLGALRQRESSDTVKAVTMIKKAKNGRYVVSVGFMGTGSRFYDWFSNLRFVPQEGFHQGFYQLALYFEQNAERILFPDTAKELGLEKLTLKDVIEELKSPDSRFFLWMAGHSQGGAVMQIYAHRLIHDKGALPQNIVGYGFASPTAATGEREQDPAAYPLYHVINSDDYVPRMGALCHLGMGLRYQANDPMRAAAYGWTEQDADKPTRDTLKRLCARATDTPTMMESITALLRALLDCKGEEMLASLSDKRWSIAPIDKVLTAAGNKAQELLTSTTQYVRAAYLDLVGRDMDEGLIDTLTKEYVEALEPIPFLAILRALGELVLPAHSINREHGKVMGAYAYIAQRGLSALTPFVWEKNPSAPPSLREAALVQWQEYPLPTRPLGATRTARVLHPPRFAGKVRGISALRSVYARPIRRGNAG